MRSRTTVRVLATLLAALLALPVLAALPADAASTYHLAVDGDDSSPGSSADPWATFGYALEQLEAGDTLVVHGGDYVEAVFNPQIADGQPDRRITVRAAAGERPVIHGNLKLTNADHWTIDGINVTWRDGVTGDTALVTFSNGDGWEFINAEVWDAHYYGAVMVVDNDGSEHNPPEQQPSNWRIANNCIHDTVPTHGYSQDHNIYVVAGRDAGTGPGTIERNILYGAPNGNNIKIGPGIEDRAGGQNVTIRNNTMYDAFHNVLVAWTAEGTVIEGNLMDRGPSGYGKDWYPNVRGFDLTGSGNVARDNAGWGGPQVIDNRGIDGHEGQDSPLVDGGGNVVAAPDFATVGCDGFRPSGTAAAYGRWAGLDDRGLERLPVRHAGPTRVSTAVAVADQTHPDGASAVVLARADDYADALAGGPLAATVDGPLLLTGRDRLDGDTADAIRRLAPDRVFLLGGTVALSDEVADQVRNLGVDVDRVAGQTRFDTAVKVADKLVDLGGDIDHAYVVEGRNADPSRGWPDAVSAGALAATEGVPVLPVERDRLPGEVADFIVRHDLPTVTVVGGTVAVSDQTADQIGSLARVDRLAGQTRFDTAVKVADRAVDAGADTSTVWLATGRAFPDALAAGPAAAATGGVLLLVDTTGLPGPVEQFLSDVDGTVNVVGGVGAVGRGVAGTAADRAS